MLHNPDTIRDRLSRIPKSNNAQKFSNSASLMLQAWSAARLLPDLTISTFQGIFSAFKRFSGMIKSLTPPDIRPPFARYSHGVEVPAGQRIVFTSGQLGIAADDTIPADVEGQARLCFENIKAILADAGMDMSNLVRINAYVTGREHMQGYMKVRDEFTADPAPASTLMIVSGFTREEFVVEVEVTAAKA
jgi:enamine deaminase RidA (YjgF/YER057c/UK114 family)